MLKYYCDRCGVECKAEDLTTVYIPKENRNNGSFVSEHIEACLACAAEYNKISDMLIDLKIAVFGKYYPLKGEQYGQTNTKP